MDKYEYKIKSEEIKELIAQKEYARAAEIADTIDWRRVKSVMMLCTISDLYKINRRYEDSRDLLLLAYDRHPGGRTIVYALCELSIKMGEIPQAVEYCKEFVNIAPRDHARYILQYKIYEAQGVSLEERIEVLEELKKHDYREKWAYELAYLYHRIGLASKCVDECDELIVWFGDGRYVIKAMELKMLHQPLTPEQQYKYDNRFAPVTEEKVEEAPVEEQAAEEITEEEQSASREETPEEESGSTTIWSGEEVAVAMEPLDIDTRETKVFPVEEINIQVQTMDPSNQYNTINLQAELAAGLKELLNEESKDEITQAIIAPLMQTDTIPEEEVTKIISMSDEEEVLKESSENIDKVVEAETIIWSKEEMEEITAEETPAAEEAEITEEVEAENIAATEEAVSTEATTEEQVIEELAEEPATTGSRVMEQMRRNSAEPPKEMAKVLSMEADGQISFLVEEQNKVEQQITGQLSIEDIMAEWERMKKELEERGKEKVRQHVKENTGQMFTEFEASVRDGLLEQLESGMSIEEAIAKAEENSPVEEEEEIPVPSTLEDEDSEEEEIQEASEDLPEEEIQEASEDLPEEESQEASEDLPEEEFQEASEDLPEEEFQEASEDLPEEESQEASEDLPEEESEVAEEAVTEEITAEEATEEVVTEEAGSRENRGGKVRNLTKEEKELFGPYIQGKSSKEQLLQALDNISMDAYTGNVIITGAEGLDTLGLARSIVQEIRVTDNNFSGKIAKISGEALNKRNVDEVLSGLLNGALIVQRANNMNEKTVEALYKSLQQENIGIVVILEGTKKAMDSFLEENDKLKNCFTARVDMEVLSDAALVDYCKKYARDNEYVMDEFAVLALHQIITDRQTNDHAVTLMEVREIMDEAMDNAGRKSVGHFLDILMAKRYDEEDMIIIHEKDLI